MDVAGDVCYQDWCILMVEDERVEIAYWSSTNWHEDSKSESLITSGTWRVKD